MWSGAEHDGPSCSVALPWRATGDGVDGAELELLPVSTRDRSMAMWSASSSSFGASLPEPSSFKRSSQSMGSESLLEELPELAMVCGTEREGRGGDRNGRVL